MAGNDDRKAVVRHDCSDAPSRTWKAGSQSQFTVRQRFPVADLTSLFEHPALEFGQLGQGQRYIIELNSLASRIIHESFLQRGAPVELGIQLASMLHLGAALPNMSFAADAHYHHLTDDIITGGLMRYEGGAIRVPDEPGLGVTLDEDFVKRHLISESK